MKIFAFIISLIVLGLNFLPCADADCSSSEAKQEIAGTQQKKDHTDDCSPFCKCACCTSFSINHTVAIVQAIIPDYRKNYSSFYNCTVISISFPIWQPPQLAA
jgi:hypothetical protein